VLGVTMAVMWGRRHVANLYRYLDAAHHRSRCNNFFVVERWDPAAALRQKAREQPGETVYRIVDDSQAATRGQVMDAIATRKAPTTDAYIWGHHDVCAILVYRHQVIPWGIRLDVTREQCAGVGGPFRKTTALAAQLIRACRAPAGVKVLVLCDAYDLCPTVVKACREQRVPFASTLTSHRSRFKPGWKLKAGRDGRHLCRRRRTATLVLGKPQGKARYRDGDAGWLQVSHLGVLPVVCSRTGAARKILGLVTDDPKVSAAGRIQASDRRWAIEPWLNDTKPLLGLGQDQNRSYWAAVTHLHLVCVAHALLTHRRLERQGAQGERTRDKATGMSVATAQETLRGLIWEDLITSLKKQGHEKSVFTELERLRVA
jgi:hypothetical protein